MTTLDKPDYLSLEDPQERKAQIEAVLNEMDERSRLCGDPEIPIMHRQSRYSMSCMIILVACVFSTVFLGICSVYFATLPRPVSYASTQEGKLHVIEPHLIEK